jgi:hypothetical protein
MAGRVPKKDVKMTKIRMKIKNDRYNHQKAKILSFRKVPQLTLLNKEKCNVQKP